MSVALDIPYGVRSREFAVSLKGMVNGGRERPELTCSRGSSAPESREGGGGREMEEREYNPAANGIWLYLGYCPRRGAPRRMPLGYFGALNEDRCGLSSRGLTFPS